MTRCSVLNNAKFPSTASIIFWRRCATLYEDCCILAALSSLPVPGLACVQRDLLEGRYGILGSSGSVRVGSSVGCYRSDFEDDLADIAGSEIETSVHLLGSWPSVLGTWTWPRQQSGDQGLHRSPWGSLLGVTAGDSAQTLAVDKADRHEGLLGEPWLCWSADNRVHGSG